MKVIGCIILFGIIFVRCNSNTSPGGRVNVSRKRDRNNSRISSSRGGFDNDSIWSTYMEKFDIAHVHGSGVYVDLGRTIQMGTHYYRMPYGGCPIAGKTIQLSSGGDFLSPIDSNDLSERGLAFPLTKQMNTRVGNRNVVQQLSPVSASQLLNWNYNNGTDLANCAEYARNIIPGSDRNTKYRYPFVYDSYNKMCHVLYSPMQYNQGAKYCDDNGADEGISSLICMFPEKSRCDASIFYGSANVRMDWDTACPMYPVKDAMFGRWNGSECEAIRPAYQESCDSVEDCSEVLFEYSPSDVDTDHDEDATDVVNFWKELRNNNFSSAMSRIFTPATVRDRSVDSGGVGVNWANFDPITQKCDILDVVPTCLILNAGHFALTSIGSPLASEAVPFPCNIKSRGYLEARTRSRPYDGQSDFVPYTSTDKEVLNCEKYVHSRYSESCGYYYICSEEPSTNWLYYYILGSIAVLLLFGLFVLIRRWYRSDKKNSYHEDYYYKDFYDKGERTPGWAREEQLNAGAYVWGNAERTSDVTPVRLSRNEQYN